MYNKRLNDGKGHGFLRKVKGVKGLASGIALAGAVVTFGSNSTVAQAEEVATTSGTTEVASASQVATTDTVVTTASTATETVSETVVENTATFTEPVVEAEVVNSNAPTAQEEVQTAQTDAQIEGIKAEGTTTGSIDAEIASSALDQSVAQAEKAGVEVVKTEEVVTDSYKQAEADLANQKDRVDTATETKVEVDATLTEAKKEAELAGVEFIEGAKVDYRDDASGALKDAKEQASHLAEATKAQTEVTKELTEAIEVAKESGVKVVETAGIKTTDAKKALDDLAKQVALLETSAKTQRELDAAVSEAVREARNSGLKINVVSPVVIKDIQEAIARIQTELSQLSEDVKVQVEFSNKLADTVIVANASGVFVTEGATVEHKTADAIKADVNAQVSALDKATRAQNTVTQVLDDAKFDASGKDTTVNIEGEVILSAEEAVRKAEEQATYIREIASQNEKAREDYHLAVKERDEKILQIQNEFDQAMADYVKSVADIQLRNDQEIAKVERKNAEEIIRVDEINNYELARVAKENTQRISDVDVRNQAEVARVQRINDEEVARVAKENAQRVADANTENLEELARIQRVNDEELAKIQRENMERMAAVEKANITELARVLELNEAEVARVAKENSQRIADVEYANAQAIVDSMNANEAELVRVDNINNAEIARVAKENAKRIAEVQLKYSEDVARIFVENQAEINRVAEYNAKELARVAQINVTREVEAQKANLAEISRVNKYNLAEQSRVDAHNQQEAIRVSKLNAEEIARVQKANDEEIARVTAENMKIIAEAMAQYGTDVSNWEAEKAQVEAENARRKAEYDKGMANYNALSSQKSDIETRNRQVMESKGLTYTGNYATDKATVDAWNAQNAGTKQDGSVTTGITATNNTTVAVTQGKAGPTSRPNSGLWYLVGTDGGTNLFDKPIKASAYASKGQSVEFKVSNTSNGDVTLRFHDVNSMTPVSNDNKEYAVLVFTEPGGGIGFSVAAVGDYGASSGLSIEGMGGLSSGGGYGPLIIKDYKVEVRTSAGDVQTITFNDVDNSQHVTSGATATKTGSAIRTEGTTYHGTADNTVQGSTGTLGSHSVEFDFGQSMTFHHTNTNDNLMNIIAGVFGPSSSKPKTVKVDPISIEEPPTVTPPTYDQLAVKPKPNPPADPVLLEPTLITPNLVDPNFIEGSFIEPTLITPDFVDPALITPSLKTVPASVEVKLIDPVLVNPNLVKPTLRQVELTDPTLVKPTFESVTLTSPVLTSPNLKPVELIDPVLIDPVLEKAVLIDPVLVKPVLVDPKLETIPVAPVKEQTPPPVDEPEIKSATISNVRVKAEFHNVVLVNEVTPVTIEASTHGIQLQSNVHTVGVSTTVHPVTVSQAPKNEKTVENADGVSIDGKLVAKGSEVTFGLTDEYLKAGRGHVLEYTRTDNLPQGIVLNLKETIAKSEGWTISYDKATHTLTSTLTKRSMFDLSSDLTKPAYIPDLKIVGTVTNDGATYVNTFKTKIVTADTVIRDGDGNVKESSTPNVYESNSNRVEVYTPGSNSRTNNGNVVVRYYADGEFGSDGQPIELIGRQFEVEDAEVGSSYDTSDKRVKIISHNGKTYELTAKVGGNENGKVSRGTTFVDYYYKEVPAVPKHGNVIVNYVSEDGLTIKNPVENTPSSPTGTDYSTVANKHNKIVTEDGIEYELIPTATKGIENGKVVEGTTEVTYVYKRITPKPETPTPNDNIIKPVKDMIENSTGQSISGRTLLPNTKASYTYLLDNDQYKGMTVDEATMSKAHGLIGDLSDSTVKLVFNEVKAVTAVSKKDVTDLFEYRTFSSIEDAQKDAYVADMLRVTGIKPEGDFYVYVPKDVQSYVENYVLAGESIFFTLPFEAGDYTGKFSNKVWQVNFGNGYEGNIVENNIPKLEALKKAVKAVGNAESIDVVELGSTFAYEVNGPAIEANVVGGIQSYVERDDFDELHDEYNGEFYRFAEQDIVLKDGTVIKAGDEITKYYVQTIERDANGRAIAVTFTVSPEFLAQIAEGSKFDPTGYIVVKRIAVGENIENTFDVTINDFKVVSNTVTTDTPEPKTPTPEVPVTPAVPATPIPEVPATPEVPVQAVGAVLPNTGESQSSMATVGLAMIAGAGLLALAGRKRKEEE